MNTLYIVANTTKQAQSAQRKRRESYEDKTPYYLNVIRIVRKQHPGMGLREIYRIHQPEGIGRDRFIALGLLHGFRLRSPKRYTHTTQSSAYKGLYPNLLIGRRFYSVNQVWVSDITYWKTSKGFLYIHLLMDVYSRRILGYCASKTLEAKWTLQALKMALDSRGIDDYIFTLIHHSDKGIQYISAEYNQTLDYYQINPSFSGNAYENSHMERVNQTIKNDYLAYWMPDNLDALKRDLSRACDNYNIRPHSSLKDKMTPIEYEQYLQQQPYGKGPAMKIYTLRKTPKEQPNPFQLEIPFPEMS